MNTILKKHIFTLFLFSIVLIASIVALVYFLSSMHKQAIIVRETKERVVSYEKNKQSLTDETTKLKLFDSRVLSLESKVVTVKTIPELLSTLEALAIGEGVRFEITSVDTEPVDEISKLRIETSTRGSYEKVQAFLNTIQHQPFQLKISKLFLASDMDEAVDETTDTFVASLKEKSWQGVATIDIVSF